MIPAERMEHCRPYLHQRAEGSKDRLGGDVGTAPLLHGHGAAPMNRSQHIPSDYHEQLSLKDRAVWMLGHRQFFNWQPNETAVQKTGPANAIRRLILDQDFLADIPNDGFSWECGLNDEENVRVRIWYSPCNFSEEEVAAMTRDMLDIAQWLCKVDSWEKKVQVARNGMPK